MDAHGQNRSGANNEHLADEIERHAFVLYWRETRQIFTPETTSPALWIATRIRNKSPAVRTKEILTKTAAPPPPPPPSSSSFSSFFL